jgi:hypothetical protein
MGKTKDKLLQANASSQEQVKVKKKPALLAAEQKAPAEERLNMETEQRTAPETKITEPTILVDQSKAESSFLPISKGEKVVLPEGQKKRKTLTEMYDELNASKMPTQAELEDEQKRRRRNALLSAVGDGISALANVYFTSKGAPEVKYDRSASLSARNKARWDKMDQERDANMKAYAVGRMQAEEKDRQQEISDKRFKEQMEQQSELAKLRAENERYEAAARASLEAQKRAWDIEAAEKERAWKTEENEKERASNEKQKSLDRQSNEKVAEVRSYGTSSSATNIPLGNGESVDLSKKDWSEENISNVFESLPKALKEIAYSEYSTKDTYGKPRPLSKYQMRLALGDLLSHPDAEQAREKVREIAGISSKSNHIVYKPSSKTTTKGNTIEYVPQNK